LIGNYERNKKKGFWIWTSLDNGPVGNLVGGSFSGDLDRLRRASKIELLTSWVLCEGNLKKELI
jgi:hypothetical protein